MAPCRRIGLLLAVVAFVALRQMSPAAQASQPLTGTWKLNLAKSTFDPPALAPKTLVVTYQVDEDTIAASLDGVDSMGRVVRSQYAATLDGQEYPVRGTIDGEPAPNQDAISWKRIDDRTYEAVNRVKGQVLTTRRVVVAADGRSRTTTITGRDAQGRAVHHVMFFERQ